jgi:hypothetical protein
MLTFQPPLWGSFPTTPALKVLGYWQYVPPGRVCRRKHDARRTAWLAERGYRVIRFRNHEVDEDVQRVVETIRQALEVTAPTPPQSPLLSPPLQGEGAGWG